jgi:hypothetical protein
VHVPGPGRHAARRPGRLDERPRLLEPRHRWLLGGSLPGALRPLGSVRALLGAQPLPRRHQSRPVAVRRGGAGHLPPVRAAPEPARPVPLELRLGGGGDRRSADAPDGHGVSRRSGRLRLRPPVLPRPRASRLAGRARGRAGDDLPAGRPLARLVERGGGRRAGHDRAPGPAPRAAALPAGEQPAGPRSRARARGRARGRPADPWRPS